MAVSKQRIMVQVESPQGLLRHHPPEWLEYVPELIEPAMNWLVKNGVSKDRLSFEGFGQEKPIDSNNTDEGRKNNRRVEFHIESDAK